MAKKKRTIVEYPHSYVHWSLDSGDSLSKRYEGVTRKFMAKADDMDLTERMTNLYAKTMNINKEQAEMVLGFASSAEAQTFNSLIQTAFSALNAKGAGDFGLTKQNGIYYDSKGNNAVEEKNNTIRICNEMQKYLEYLEQTFLRMEAFFSDSKGLDAYLVALKQSLGGVNTPGAQEIISKISSGKVTGVLDRDRTEVLNESQKMLYENLVGRLRPAAEGVINATKRSGRSVNMVNSVKGLMKERNTTFENALLAITTPINILTGLINEILVQDILSVGIKKKLDNALLSIDNVRSTGTQKSNSSTEFRIATSDIMVDVGLNSAKGVISVPAGISIKKSASSHDDYLDIKVKNSSLGKLMRVAMANNLIDKDEEEAIYNILANHAKQKDDGFNYTFSGNISQLLKSLYYRFLLPALSGSLTKDDFATILVVNDKVFSVYDILKPKNRHFLENLTSIKTSTNGLVNQQTWFKGKHQWVQSEKYGGTSARYAGLERSNQLIGAGGWADSWRLNLSLRGKLM